ncbi:MAG: hypothetical protein PHH63_05985 [Bacteroidales bacterium]|jgi:hypothetical protein|nr:hypothetical protein [Bacteroidales bacterium]
MILPRYAAHYVFAGKDLILRKSYIERSSDALVLSPLTEEIEHTLFYNGILIPLAATTPFTCQEVLLTLQQNQAQDNQLSIFANLSMTLGAYITTDVNAQIWLLEANLVTLQLRTDSTIIIL